MRVVLHGLRYRLWARLLHRFNLHHTRLIGPLAPDGGLVERCEWCGLSRSWGRNARPGTGTPVPGEERLDDDWGEQWGSVSGI